MRIAARLRLLALGSVAVDRLDGAVRSLPTDIARARELGAVDYFVKPVAAADFIAFFRDLEAHL